MSDSPRPDQRAIAGPGAASGSRSGTGDIAAALGYPGVPPAVPNCQGADLFQQGVVGAALLLLFPVPSRIWTLILTYVITTNGSFATNTARTIAYVQTTKSNLVLASVQLGVGGPSQHDSGTCSVSFNGLPVVAAETVYLNVNGGNVISNLFQQATVSMLYSTP